MNPLASPFFAPSVSLAAAILAGTLLGILVTERRRLGDLGSSALFRRWRTWAVIIPIYVLAVLGGPIGTLGLVLGLVFQSVREYARLVGLPPLYARTLLLMSLLICPIPLYSRELFFALPPLLLILATLQPLLTHDVKTGVRNLAFAALGFAYLPWLLAHLVLIALSPHGGTGLLLTLGLAVGLSDVGAFTLGKLFGRRKIAPVVSPNKTLAGVLGNVLGAAVAVGLMGWAVPPSLPGAIVLALPLVVGLGALWGDLVESLIKREFGVKDTGDWLPGFGGILDRVDSLILVAPLLSYVLLLAD